MPRMSMVRAIRCRRADALVERALQRFRVRRPEDALLGDDAGDEAVRRDVERRVPDLRAGRRHLRCRRRGVTSRALRSSIGMCAPSGGAQIDGRQRRGDVERDVVLARQHGDAVGADLVGGVAVGGDAIGADDDEVDLALAHQRRAHVVGDDGRVDAVAHQLPRGEPRALQERPRLVGEHRDRLAGLDRAADDAERRAVAGRRQRAGVAVGQDVRVGGHDRGAEGAHRAAAGDVLVVNQLRFAIERVLDLIDRLPGLHRGGEASASSARSPRTG